MRKKITYKLFITLTVLMLMKGNTMGQHINFATFAGADVSIKEVVGNNLNFGMFIKGTETIKTIDLAGSTAFEIKAPEGFDIIIIIDAPDVMTGPESKNIPFTLKYAFSNQGLNYTTAKASAQEVTSGISSITIPIKKNAMGLPAPPPTPLDGNNNSRGIAASAYIFFYGSAGPAGIDTVAGNYEATVNISVEYINDNE